MSPGYRILCSNCTSNRYWVPLYLLLEFGPVTVFYLIILIFQISMTTAPMTCFIMYCQLVVLVIDLVYNVVDQDISQRIFTLNEHSKLFLNILLTILDFWNLRFFHYLLPPLCVSSRLKAIHILFLGYVSAFYPFFLIFLTWCFVKLHDNNFRLFVRLWRPFHRCIVKLRRSWDAKSDIVDVFASFFLLCFSRIMYQSINFLPYQETDIFSVSDGSLVGRPYHVVADQSIPYMEALNTLLLPFQLSLFSFVFNILYTYLAASLIPYLYVQSVLVKMSTGWNCSWYFC